MKAKYWHTLYYTMYFINYHILSLDTYSKYIATPLTPQRMFCSFFYMHKYNIEQYNLFYILLPIQ